MRDLHPSLLAVLARRGYHAPSAIDRLLEPPLSLPAFEIPDMNKAVERLRRAIKSEDAVAIYADRDVDGLSGLAIIARSLRTLGAKVHWGSPISGRGVQRAVLDKLVQSGAKVMILVDCGTGENTELAWLASQGIDVIIADHHRVQTHPPPAFAWIHPGMAAEAHGETPCGTVMAFKLAEALWKSFIDPSEPERLQYFLFDHLDLVALGILADRVPLTGENRMFVWHGLRRLAHTRKEGLAALLRFFRIKGDTVTVRQATWQIIPLLNAAGRLGEPQWTTNLLLTEDSWTARQCIDALLGLNTARRKAQDESVSYFEKAVLEQCSIEKDLVLVATARDLEPSVTGLAAQSLVQKYGRPAFLFVEQGDELVGSGRGTSEIDLFLWIERHQEILVKYGGHHGAVGLTVRKDNFPMLREGLLKAAEEIVAGATKSVREPEAVVHLDEATSEWWDHLMSLEPFGPGFEVPAFELTHLDGMVVRSKRSPSKVMLKRGAFSWPAELPGAGELPARIVAVPQATPKEDFPFKWLVQPT